MATQIERGLRPVHIPDKKSGINKKIAALALTGAIAMGGIGMFAANQQGEQTRPEPTPISGGVGNPNESNNPTVIKTSSPEATPSETENNPENDLGVFAINTWLDTLSSKQQVDENDKFLDFNIQNKEEWQHLMENLNNTGNPAEPLKVSWLGGFTSPSVIEDNKFAGHKVSGEVEFNNVVLSADEQELTAADKANGYTYKGLVKIAYAERFYNYYYEPSNQNNIGNKENVVEWIHQPEEQNPNFTQWTDGSIKFPIALVNGKWTAKLDNVKQTTVSVQRLSCSL
jgi:hypothetical protein